MKRAVVVLMLLCSVPLMAQRKGSTEVGGSISFHSSQDAQQRNYSDLGFDGLIAYYLSRNIGIDIEPGVGISFQPDSVSISTLIMGSVRMRLFDLVPSGYRKNDIYRLDLGVSSSIFANLGVGLWSEGYSLSQKPSTTYSGPAVIAGIGTFSQFGRFSTLRVKLQFIELFPGGEVFKKRRTLVQVGVGFGLFLRS
ncbi:MAG TPA: hypothetical protein PKI90_12435 [bacterium]|nr:hypothetical protein [bacterium]